MSLRFALNDVLVVACPFCEVVPGAGCIQVRGPNRGGPAQATHAGRIQVAAIAALQARPSGDGEMTPFAVAMKDLGDAIENAHRAIAHAKQDLHRAAVAAGMVCPVHVCSLCEPLHSGS